MRGVCALGGEERNGFCYVNEMFNIFSKYLHRSTWVLDGALVLCMHHRKCIHWESIRLFELETKSYMLMSVDVDTIKISWPVLSGYDACLRVWEREKSSFIVSMIQIASVADQEPISPGPECPWCLISTVNLGSGAQYDKWLPCHVTGEYSLDARLEQCIPEFLAALQVLMSDCPSSIKLKF